MKILPWSFVLLFVSSLLLAILAPNPAQARDVGIIQAESQRTYVPIRYLSEQFGYTVHWDAERQQIAVQGSEEIVELFVGRQEIAVNGERAAIDAAPFAANGITFVPLRVIVEALGLQVEWEPTKQEARIAKGDAFVAIPAVTEQRWKESLGSPVKHTTKTFTVHKKSLHANLVIVDLLHAKIDLSVGLAEGGVGSVSSLESIAQRHQAAVAINGTFFDAYNESSVKTPYGYVVVDGEIVKRAPGDQRSVIVFGKNNDAGLIPGDAFLEAYEEGWVDGAIQAGPRLVSGGEIAVDPVAEGFRDPKILTSAAARSAVGVTADHRLILLTTSGATIPQLAEMMRQAGASDAMNLDGGASSGLYVQGKYITRPGREISNALLISVQ